MRVVFSILRTGELSLSICEGTTPIHMWRIQDDPERSKILRPLRSLLSDPAFRFPQREKDGIFESILDDGLVTEFLGSMPCPLISDPIWRFPSAKADFTALQRVFSRLQTAKPPAHAAEVVIAGNVGGAPTGHDPKLLSEFQEIKAEMKARNPIGKVGMKAAAVKIAQALETKFISDSVAAYGGKYEEVALHEADTLSIALRTLTSEFLLTANDGLTIICYLYELVSDPQGLPVGSFCAIVQTINDMVQKGNRSTKDVKFGQALDYACIDGLQTRLALLKRVIQTKKRIAGETDYRYATPENIFSVTSQVVREHLGDMLLGTAFKHLPFSQNKSSYHLTGIIQVLKELTDVRTQCLSAEYETSMNRTLDAYKVSILKHPDFLQLSDEEATCFLRLLKPMMEAFCVELEKLFETYMAEDLLKTTVAKQTLPFPPDVSAEGFLESTFSTMLTEHSAPLREIAGAADQKLAAHYKREYSDIVRQIIKGFGQLATSVFLSDVPKMAHEKRRLEEIYTTVIKIIEGRRLDYKNETVLGRITALTIKLCDTYRLGRPCSDEEIELMLSAKCGDLRP